MEVTHHLSGQGNEMAKYAILWNPTEPVPIRGHATASRLVEAEGSPGDPRVTTADIASPREAADLARSPEVRAIAISMRTVLIRPRSVPASDARAGWNMAATGADRCGWTGAGVKVAVLDTGIDCTHQAFAGVDLVRKNFSADGPDDQEGHGTHCAGILFGRPAGATPGGVAPGVKQALIGKVLGNNGCGTSDAIFEGLQWAINEGAQVISLSLGLDYAAEVEDLVSLGWPLDVAVSRSLEAFRQNALMADLVMGFAHARTPTGMDPLIVAAAGNESRRDLGKHVRSACSLPAIVADLSVGAIGMAGALYDIAEFSNENPHVVAPGVGIASARRGGGMEVMSGTSMACPHVAGLAALWVESLSSRQRAAGGSTIRSHLVARASREGFVDGLSDEDIGNGMAMAPPPRP